MRRKLFTMSISTAQCDIYNILQHVLEFKFDFQEINNNKNDWERNFKGKLAFQTMK